MFVVLSGQILQIQLHVHVFGRVAARKLHVVSQQLTLQLVLGEHRRVVQVLRHVGVRMEGQLSSPGRVSKLTRRRNGINGKERFGQRETANQRLLLDLIRKTSTGQGGKMCVSGEKHGTQNEL